MRFVAPALTLALALSLTSAIAGAGATTTGDSEAVTWSVSPVDDSDGSRFSFDYAVDPGTQIRDAVEISNLGDTAATFTLYATDAVNDFETGAFGLLASDDEPVGLGSWITLSDSTITLEPAQRATVPFQVLVPSDATPGDHAAGIVASVTSRTSQGDQAVELEQRVGARVYLAVSGALRADLDVVGLVSTYEPSWNPFVGGTMVVDFAVTNSGNQRIDATSQVSIVGPFGVPLASASGEPLRNLLPGQTVRVRVPLADVAPLGLAFTDVGVTAGPVGSADTPIEPVPESETDTAVPGNDSPPAAESTATDSGADADPVSELVDVNAVEDVPATLEYPVVTESGVSLAVSWIILIIVAIGVGMIVVARRSIEGARASLQEELDRLEAAERALAARPETASGQPAVDAERVS